jgi:hypothetical protein
MRFACALPIDSQEGLGRPCVSSRRVPQARRASERSPEGARSSTQRFGADALRHCPLDRFLRRRRRRRERLDCPALGGCTNPSKLEVTSPRSSLRTPRLHLADLELALRLGSTLPRIGSGRERPSPRFGSHRLPRLASALGSRLRESRHTDTSASASERRRRLELQGARSEPQHPRRRDAIRAALAFDPTARVIDVAADGDPARSLGGDQREEACSTGLCATPEASSCDVRPGTVQRTAPHGPARRRNALGVAQPTTGFDHRSGARSLLTRSSCSKVLPPPRRPVRVSLANSLPT